MSGVTLGGLVLWGIVTGVDLVSFLQAMVARPLVAATVAGAILGDPSAGVLIGMVLELFALEVLPVGGARYPDYGPAAVAACAVAAGRGPEALGLGVVVGLGLAQIGEWSIVALRRWNTTHVRRAAAALDAGDLKVIQRVQLAGIGRDALRALLLTLGGLGVALAVRRWPPVAGRPALLLLAVLVGIGLATAAINGKRLASGRTGLAWLTTGLAGGIAWLFLR
ncbi:MAG: PTS sugar transporter subunit IIC [Gemmatimonadota bacterium]|nr:PTS sugar transporter subunit IIC [Gemmatimonadota bacterium]